jgi:GDP-L-fucose synthase
MVGSALVRRLQVIDCELLTTERNEVDLTRQSAVEAWMQAQKPDTVIVAAAKVGGIHANDTAPADFIYANLAIETNVIHASWLAGVDKLLFLGSSCIYPREAPQPMAEDALLTGPLEPTNQWYAVAKIAGLKMCAAYRRQYGARFISAMPTNLYGPGDNYDLETSHVIPALIAKAHAAKIAQAPKMEIWGSGLPRREFLFVDDLADALVWILERYEAEEHINVGTGQDITIAELGTTVADAVGFRGKLEFDRTKPEGAPRKLLNVNRLNALGWRAKTDLRSGLMIAYTEFLRSRS